MKKFRITVDGKVYDVAVEILDEPGVQAHASTPVRAAASDRAPAAASSKTGGGPAGAVPSPMAGRIVSIEVKPGQKVTRGAALVVLEAMKMNTQVPSPADGTVSEILVQIGANVEEDQPLVVIA